MEIDFRALQSFDLAEIARGDLSAPEPSLLLREDGQALLYPSAVNVVYGEPGGGKTWLALAAARQVAEAGGNIALLDWEDSPRTAAARLQALGLSLPLFEQVGYFRPSGPLPSEDVARLGQLVADPGIALVVLDSVAEALAGEGADENDAGAVSGWAQRVLRPLTRAGACVLLVDHVVKDAEGHHGRRWARGSSAKLALIDGAAYALEVDLPFSRHQGGTARLVVGKDRHGSVGSVGATAAVVSFEVAGGGLSGLRLVEPVEGEQVNTDQRLDPRRVPEALAASGGRWASRAEAAEALGVSGEVASRLLGQAVRSGLVVEDRSGTRCTYTLPPANVVPIRGEKEEAW